MFPIVGIGASAGGLDALKQFLAQIPADCKAAFVVVQHLERERPSLLSELLCQFSPLPVHEIANGMLVHPGQVYVIPPDRRLTMSSGVLYLEPPSGGRTHFQPIDDFFRSLADERQSQSVGVILSGSGSDGTLGLEAIREVGGLVAVQEPASARYSDMPRRVVEGGLADIVDPPAYLPARILQFLEQRSPALLGGTVLEDADGTLLSALLNLLNQHTGKDFSSYKKNTLYRRIERRMGVVGLSKLQDYRLFLETRGDEADALTKELLISVTRFCRDAEVWERFGNEIFPELFASREDGTQLRAWVPGCATGEEAYTLAMTFLDAMERSGQARQLSLQIFATDLNPRVIAIARKGFYPASIAEDVPAAWLRRYFTPQGEGYLIHKKIREMVIFAPHNLLVDPPFSRLDLLSCRNLLIYLAPDVHATLLGRFHYSMNSDAYLVLGSSESVGSATHLFKPVAGNAQIYRRLECLQAETRFNFLSGVGSVPPSTLMTAMDDTIKPSASVDLKTLSDRFIIQYLAPTALLTNENGDILHISGKPGRYLELAEGRATFNVLALVRDAFKAALSEVFWDARQMNQASRVVATQEATEGIGRVCVQITVSPVLDPIAPAGMMMVMFEDAPCLQSGAVVQDEERSARQSSRLLMLEQMLRQTRASLQATREEMQTSREELTSTNEELQSTNEELTTSAEELRTMNEELVRARAESEQALARFTDLFDSAPVGYFTLDRSGTILQVNLAGAALLDVEREHASSSRFVMFVTEADRAAFRECLEQAYESGQEHRCEIALWRENGEPRYVRISALSIFGGQECRVVAVDLTESRQVQSALRDSEASYRALFEHSKDAMLIILRSDRPTFISANQRALELFGIPDEQEFNLVQVFDLSTERQPDGRLSTEKAEEMLDIAERQGSHFFEWSHRRVDGSTFVSEILLTALTIHGQRVIQASIRDISQRRQAEEQLQLAAMVYRHSSEAMMVTDAEDRIMAINKAFTRLTGYVESEILGQMPLMLLAHHDENVMGSEISDALRATGSWQGELTGRRKNGETFVEWMTINTAWRDDGAVHRRVALFSDISEKKKHEELIWQQANFDLLTGQPNRRMFSDRLAQEIRRANRDHRGFVLMFIDLDRFKEVNDTLGHDVGDQLLKEAAERLRRSLRETDFLGRLGGDEFAIILDELHEPSHIDRVAQKILDALAQPFTLGNEVAYVSASIGISLYPEDCSKMEELLKNADQAMYAAKHLGRNRFSYFTPAMQKNAQTRMRMANDLRVALSERQFSLHYQPIIDLRTGAIHKAEALLRWTHPVDGPVSPATFIPLAEDTGLIIDIGNWVFHEAVRQVEVWRKRYAPDFQISINKSPVQFRDDRNNQMHHWIAHMRALGLPGQAVTVEITEGMLMDASADNLLRFQVFRDAGIQVALDDFGTGYSALSYLKKFDIDYLKIDQSFVRNLAPGSEDMALCEAIIVMAHKLQLKVVAEGIETAEQRDLLLAAGCDFAQGYFFARPLPADAFERLLDSAQPR